MWSRSRLNKEIPRLFQLSPRDLQTAQQFFGYAPTESFRDICRNQSGSPPQLRNDPKLLRPRKFLGQSIRLKRQLVRSLLNR
jgi:hypothetical protein